MKMIDCALDYASRGWAVFPVYGITDGYCACGDPTCSSPGKHPMIGGGCKSATTNAGTISNWWTEYPNANIGIATGSGSGLLVVDVDEGPGKNGFASLAKLEDQVGLIPKNLVVRTGSGGQHIYLKAPDTVVRNSASKLAPFIDIRGEGGYVVAPPSLHISGDFYTWENAHA